MEGRNQKQRLVLPMELYHEMNVGLVSEVAVGV
jgi:hypothetical protein